METPSSNAWIVEEMQDEPLEEGWKGHEGADGPRTVPEPPARPDEHAQWDEASGRWIAWDPATSSWQPDGPAPATPAAEATDETTDEAPA